MSPRYKPFMTAADLIARLERMDPNTAIVCMDAVDGYYAAIGVAELDLAVRRPAARTKGYGELINHETLPKGSRAVKIKGAFVGLLNERRREP